MIASETDRRICVTVTFATDDRGVEVAAKVLDRVMDLPQHLDALSWSEFHLEDEDDSDG